MSSIQPGVKTAWNPAAPSAAKATQTPAAPPPAGAPVGGLKNGPGADTFTASNYLNSPAKPAAAATPGGTPGGTPTATPTATPFGTPATTSSGTPFGTPSSTPATTPSGTPYGTPAGTPSATPSSAGSAHVQIVLKALEDLNAPEDLIEAYKEQYRLLGLYDDSPGGTPGGAIPGGATPAGNTPVSGGYPPAGGIPRPATPSSVTPASGIPGAATPASNIPGNVGQWISQAQTILAASGIPMEKMSAQDIAAIIQYESNGNPEAINLNDDNARRGTPSIGLMQTIQTTFDSNKLPGHDNIRNPVDNIIAGVRYAIATYGSVSNVPGIVNLRQGRGYQGY